MYIEKRRYGGQNLDSDEDDDPDIVGKTPNTQRRIVDEKAKQKVKKLGTVATFFTLIKGFICTSIVYLPKSNMINGGYGFANICLVCSCVLTITCAMKILAVRKECNATSYTSLGYQLYGSVGKLIVNFALAGSQMGFCCSYVYFIVENIDDFLSEVFDVSLSRNLLALFVFLVFASLSYVRKIQKFAAFHMFANLIIATTIIAVVVEGSINIKDEGSQLKTVPFISSVSAAIGFSAYIFEGIGLVIPVYEITENKEKYPYIVACVILTCCTTFMFFGTFCAVAWG